MEHTQESKQVISKELIFLDSELKEQQAVIKMIVEKAQQANYVTDSDVLFKAVMQRESEVPTAIGYQIAIPHGKTEAVVSPFIAFVRTQEEFRWSATNEEMARLIFLIGVPEKSEGKLHLKFISQLSKRLLDDEFRSKLLVETDVNKVFEQMNAIEV